MKRLLVAFIQAYKIVLSPLLGANCRFEPSCSTYGIEAIERFGALRGSWLTIKRLMRCRPFGPCGYDPVPLTWPTKKKH